MCVSVREREEKIILPALNFRPKIVCFVADAAIEAAKAAHCPAQEVNCERGRGSSLLVTKPKDLTK